MKLMTAPALIAALFLAGCGGTDAESADPAEETASTAAPAATASVTPSPTPEPTQAFPDGYPKVVAVSEIPEPVSSAFEGADKAVAVAEGVWADLAPGTSPEESASAGVYDGYCASIDKFEKDYLGGQESAGSCW
jgi:hypothetical protein